MPLARHDKEKIHILNLIEFLLTCLLRGMTVSEDVWNGIRWVSTHMPLARHDKPDSNFWHLHNRFYSHASCEAWPSGERFRRSYTVVSTHMPLARHDRNSLLLISCVNSFLLTCLLRGMTVYWQDALFVSRFLLTCLLRGMTPRQFPAWCQCQVSTHMPLARHDIIQTPLQAS